MDYEYLKTPIGEQSLDAVPVIPSRAKKGITLDDFAAHMPDHKYIFKPMRDLWPAGSVNAELPKMTDADGKMITATQWLDEHSTVQQMTWMPGEPMMIIDRLMDAGGWIQREGFACFNQYREPSIKHGDPNQVEPWLDHVHMVYPDDKQHIINWLAQRVQRPQEKINHALVLGGEPGVGKDTILEPVLQAVGPWNCTEISPAALLGRFNGFVKSVILRINEARDLGEFDRFKFYDHTKTLIAAPPDVLRVDEKHKHEYCVPNVVGVVLTTNHKTAGLYLPANDRRHYVAWSRLEEGNLSERYFSELYEWYANGGNEHVAAYLARHDLSSFDAKAPPPKTDAFWVMVNASRAPEDSELADVLDALNQPDAVTISRLTLKAEVLGYSGFVEYLKERKNRRKFPHRMEEAKYEAVRNPDAKDGMWSIDGKRQAVYGKRVLSESERITAAAKLCR